MRNWIERFGSPHEHAGSADDYQTRQGFGETMGWPGLQPKL